MPPAETTKSALRRIVSAGDLDLAYPDNQKSLGSVILSPDSPELIAGVRVQPFPLFPDDRGYFLEVQRMVRGLIAGFPPETTQIAAALNYPGTIKAFHH